MTLLLPQAVGVARKHCCLAICNGFSLNKMQPGKHLLARFVMIPFSGHRI
jgi:hypothetical protein